MPGFTPSEPPNSDPLGEVVDLLHRLGPPGVPTPARLAAGFRVLVAAMDRHGYRVIRGADVLETWRSGPASHGWVDANALRPGKGELRPVPEARGVVRMLRAHVLEVWRDEDAGGWVVRMDGSRLDVTATQAQGMALAESAAEGAGASP